MDPDSEERRTLDDGRYVLEYVLGAGSTATVYRATDTLLDVERAIKVLRDYVPESTRRRLRAEARALARMDHPHVLRVFDVGTEGDRDYIVMALARGGSLQDVVDSGGPLGEAAALRYGLQILSGLAAAHARGIVHRDVKPQNVLLDAEGSALVCDFGIALHAEDDAQRSTRTGVALGTIAYMAPEQRLDSRSVGPSADLYAVGATLYYLVTAGNPVDLFAAGPDDPRWEGLSPAVRDILVRATRHRPGDRYPAAQTMAAEISRVLGGTAEVRQDPLDPSSFPPPSERLPGGAAPTMVDLLDAEDQVVTEERTAGRRGRLAILLVALLLLLGSGATAILLLEPAGPRGGEAPEPVAEAPPEPVAEAAPEPVAEAADGSEPVAGTADESEPVAEAADESEPLAEAAAESASEELAAPSEAAGERSGEPAGTAEPGPAEPPLGTWTGSFNGRPATFELRGASEAITGTVTVRQGGAEVTTPVEGSWDPATRTLVLEDRIDSFDAGRYRAVLGEEGEEFEGRFEGRYNQRVVLFTLEKP